jgi:hypothetical protein
VYTILLLSTHPSIPGLRSGLQRIKPFPFLCQVTICYPLFDVLLVFPVLSFQLQTWCWPQLHGMTLDA